MKDTGQINIPEKREEHAHGQQKIAAQQAKEKLKEEEKSAKEK
jgi:hypothetical protein